MKFVVLLQDDPSASPDIRSRLMPDHLDFLETHANQIAAAGPLMRQDGQAGGGLWEVDATDAAAVDALIKADPFWPSGLRASYQILTWRQVFSGGKRLI